MNTLILNPQVIKESPAINSWQPSITKRISKHFSIITNLHNNHQNIISKKLGISMRIRKGGYTPKSGLLIAEELIKLQINGSALDIGTGEVGFLANCLAALGASSVYATDIDACAINWAKQASEESAKIRWINCDLFPQNLTPGTFSIIVSNPAQMPMPTEGHTHDYGGSDGRKYITQIIERSSNLLCADGRLIMLCFDFLGIDRNYGEKPLAEIALDYGLQTQVLARHHRSIRKGGQTESNLGWIEKVYPKYSFQKDNDGNYHHEIIVFEMKF